MIVLRWMARKQNHLFMLQKIIVGNLQPLTDKCIRRGQYECRRAYMIVDVLSIAIRRDQANVSSTARVLVMTQVLRRRIWMLPIHSKMVG
jgi:hypothetical protein